MEPELTTADSRSDFSTIEVARRLGLAVRSVQLMVDRGELDAWKTPGGHRRISRASVERWLALRPSHGVNTTPAPLDAGAHEGSGGASAAHRGGSRGRAGGPLRALLIEDSRHYQNLVRLLVQDEFPGLELEVSDDGIAGLIMAGSMQPDIILVDLLLPGVDGGALLRGLRAQRLFDDTQLIVITSLSGDELRPYTIGLNDLPVVHKDRLVIDLPIALRTAAAKLQKLQRAAA